MQINEFVDEIKKRFPKVTEVEIDDLTEWIEQTGIKSIQLPVMLTCIKTKVKTKNFPRLGTIREYWNDQNSNAHPQEPSYSALKNNQSKPVQDIYGRLKLIRNKLKNFDHVTNQDLDFLHAWEDILWIWESLSAAGWENHRIVAYVDKIKDAIAEGRSVGHDAIKEIIAQSDATRTRRVEHISEIAGRAL